MLCKICQKVDVPADGQGGFIYEAPPFPGASAEAVCYGCDAGLYNPTEDAREERAADVLHAVLVENCGHPHAVVKRYVGSTDTYNYCPDCMHTWGGEETPAKKALIRAAAMADVTEQDEVEGRV